MAQAARATRVVDEGVPVRELTREEARELFEREAQRYLGMGGEDFLRAWDEDRLAGHPDQSRVMSVAILIPLVR
jgi:hypothetical protein